jgi:type I restriction enzyme, S subunit
MSKSWPSVSLDELIRLERRPVEVDPQRKYQEIGIYCFGRGIFHKTPRTGLEVGDKNLYELRDGDLILQVTFAWEGAIALCSKAENGLFGSTRYPTFRVDETRCYAPFLVRYLGTRDGLDQINKICPGSAGRNRVLSLKRIHEVMIPLPSLPEQRRIVARIEELAVKVNEAQRLRQNVAVEAERLLVCMAHRHDLKDAEKAAQEWQRVQLGDVMEYVDDSHRVQTDSSFPNLGIYSFGRGLFRKPPIDGALTSATTLRRVRKGQFIYSRLFAFEGAYGLVTDEFDGCYVSNEYPTFECHPNQARAEFVAAYFKSPFVWKEVAAGSKGLGDRRQRVQPERILSHKIWLPPMKWQNRIAEVQMQMDALKKQQVETVAGLDALLPSILDKAFKGEL